MADDNSDGAGGDTAASLNDSSKPVGADAGPRKASDTKRVLACGTCRKRKLKCDSKRPKCSTCARLGHPCEYDEVRKKSGPKRGYVKSLEARLNQLESLLEQNIDLPNTESQSTQNLSQRSAEPRVEESPPTGTYNIGAPDLELGPAPLMTDHDVNILSDMVMPGEVEFSWDMISLGLEEPLPNTDVMDELYQLYFQKVHPSLPMIHRPRFMTSLRLGPNSRPPVCLRYIMWALACSVSSKHIASAEQFYRQARKYLEKDEMQGHGESFISVSHAQAWNLVACYEFKNMYFPRAWLSVGRATRLVQMLGLHRQDRLGLDVKQTLGPPRDWIEREERRRTFWVAFCQDRYASIGTGWPMAFDEQDVLTNLPASEEAFLTGSAEPTPVLADVLKGDGISSISALASVILLATLFGRNLTHLHRPSDDDNDHDLSGEFWRRHRSLDNIILNTSLSMPGHLRLPEGLSDPKIVFANMNIHTSTICLHQAAIFKADKHKLPAHISSESKRRCLVAADQIANLMRMVSHQDLTTLNPFSAFCLYVASRVFVQYLKFKKDDHTVRSSLIFLLQAMHALKDLNPLVESFLVQLDVDLEGFGINIPLPQAQTRNRTLPGDIPANFDSIKCSPLIEIRDSQNQTIHPSKDSRSQTNPITDSVNWDANTSMDQNPYFATRIFDNGAPQNTMNQHGLTPPFSNGSNSSRAHSNQPTPTSSTNMQQSNSPTAQMSSTQADMQSFGISTATDDMWTSQMPYKKSPDSHKFVQSTFGTTSPVDGHSMSAPSLQDQQSMNMMNTSQLGTGGIGLTPGPTGMTPTQNEGTGMTPGFPMTPLSEWQNMNMDENSNLWFQ